MRFYTILRPLVVCIVFYTSRAISESAPVIKGSSASNTFKNATSFIHELYSEWIDQSKPLESKFVSEVYKYYKKDAHNAFANNLMGIIYYESKNMSGASGFFKTACEITLFTEEDYVKNYIRAQNLVDFRGTIRVLSNALQDDIYNILLIDTLYTWMSHAIKHHNYPLTDLVRLIIQLPQMHPFWVLFAETVLETSIIPNLSTSAIARFTLYGLSIFPRSCALHILRATLYMRENNTVCARQLYKSAVQLTHLLQTSFNATEYLDILSAYLTTDSAGRTTNSDRINTAEATLSTDVMCIPHLYRHTLADYQQLYATISTTIGTAWTNLSTHHLIPKARRDIQPIVPYSVQTATYDYFNGTPSVNVHLPSLQVGCSSPLRCARPGFLIADAQETLSTHYVTLAHNLSAIETESIGLLYSSHTLEHLSHSLPPETCLSYPKTNREDKSCYNELDATLAEWHRVLAYQGVLLVSVPDLAVLSDRFLAFRNTTPNMEVVRRILFGGQKDQFDFHKNAFFFEYLQELLQSHHFCEVEKVYQLGLFMDASGTTFTGKDMISLSVRAKKCKTS